MASFCAPCALMITKSPRLSGLCASAHSSQFRHSPLWSGRKLSQAIGVGLGGCCGFDLHDDDPDRLLRDAVYVADVLADLFDGRVRAHWRLVLRQADFAGVPHLSVPQKFSIARLTSSHAPSAYLCSMTCPSAATCSVVESLKSITRHSYVSGSLRSVVRPMIIRPIVCARASSPAGRISSVTRRAIIFYPKTPTA